MNSYNAIYINSTQGNKRESGEIRISHGRVSFVGESTTFDIPFDYLKITHGGNNRELTFLLYKSKPDISIYTTDKNIVRDPDLMAHPELGLHLHSIRQSRRKLWMGTLLVLVILLGGIGSIFLLKKPMVRSVANQIPVEWEQKIGDKLFQTMSLQYKFINNDTLRDELLKVAKPLLAQVEKDGRKIEIYFVNDAGINALALPGGKVIIQTGLIEHAKSWEEVMGVLSHELAHVTHRHHIQGVINNLGLYVILSAMIGDVSAIAGTVMNTGGELASLSNSREFENEADDRALEYMIAAKMNPNGFISFFETLQKQSNNQLEQYTSFLSTHPATQERIDRLRKELKNKKIDFKPIQSNFNQYKQLINHLK